MAGEKLTQSGLDNFRGMQDKSHVTELDEKRIKALSDLEPPHRINTRQRFGEQETNYDNVDRYPGVILWRVEEGQVYDPSIVQEAITAQSSITYLKLGDQIDDLKKEQQKNGDALRDEVPRNWNGTIIMDLDGVRRSLTAKEERSAKVTDQNLLYESTDPADFAKVARRKVIYEVEIEEGLVMTGGTMTPELIIEILNNALNKAKLSPELRSRLINSKTETVFSDLDILRDLIIANKINLDAIETNRKINLVPDNLAADKKPVIKEEVIVDTAKPIKAD